MVEDARSLFKRFYKIGMIAITVALAGLTVLAYVSATLGNGLLLLSGILALLTLMAGLSISRLDDLDAQSETYRQIGLEMRNLLKGSTRYANAEPEVHRLDASTIDEARRMASGGASIHEVCNAIDPQHAGNDPARKQAFRKVVQALIDQS